MNKIQRQLLIRVLACIVIVGATLLAFVVKQNDLTRLRLEIPLVDRELKQIVEANGRLLYEIEQFEQPAHLFELARKPDFSHLHQPYLKDVIVLPEGQHDESAN